MAKYYQGKDITIRFNVLKDGQEAEPASATVKVYSNRKFIKEDVADIFGDEVRYILKGEFVENTGEYAFVFDVDIRNLGSYTHVVNIDVEQLPVMEEANTNDYIQ